VYIFTYIHATLACIHNTPWPGSAIELYLPSDRCLSAKLVPTFTDRWCNVVSVTDPYGRILGSSQKYSPLSVFCYTILHIYLRIRAFLHLVCLFFDIPNEICIIRMAAIESGCEPSGSCHIITYGNLIAWLPTHLCTVCG
jgi:hypothetical protein